VPTLASCSFDKHKLILIILGKQHQYTFKSDLQIQLFLSPHFYLLYLLFIAYQRTTACQIWCVFETLCILLCASVVFAMLSDFPIVNVVNKAADTMVGETWEDVWCGCH